MNRFRYLTGVVLTAAVIFFAFQNLDTEEVRFLLWRFEASVSLIALIPFLVGLLLGGVTALYYRARRGREVGKKPEQLPPEPASDNPPPASGRTAEPVNRADA